jgi:hypothetical protein
MPIEKLVMENFKSIKSLTLNCKRVNLFIGEPNTGKSNILEAIGILSHLGAGLPLSSFVRFEVMTDLFYDRILDESIKISFDEKALDIEFKNGAFQGFYSALQNQSVVRSPVFGYSYGGGGPPGPNPEFQAFKYYKFTGRRDFQNPTSEFLRPPDGDNLLAVVMTRKELRSLVSEIFGKFGYRIVFKPQEGRIEVLKELKDVIFSFPYSLTSDTLQRLVFYLAAIYSNRESILSFEEPEAHAFPYYTKYLAERVALDKGNNQYFISTHNPYFLTSVLEKTPKEEAAIFAITLDDYKTKAIPIAEKQREKILADMGYDFFFNIEKFLD